MEKSKILAAILGMAMLFSGMSTVKSDGFGPHNHRCGPFGLRILKELDLSDSQKDDIIELIEKYREQGENVRDQLFAARKDTIDELKGEPFNDDFEQKARKIFQEQIAPLLEDIMVLKSKFMAELRMLLSAEQLDLLDEKRSEIYEKRNMHMQFNNSMIDKWLQTTLE